jgi:hypothetical protein
LLNILLLLFGKRQSCIMQQREIENLREIIALLKAKTGD